MFTKSRRIAALAAVTAVAGAGGIATAADRGRGKPPKPPIGAIADALGVEHAELRAALLAARPDDAVRPQRPTPEAFAAEIAEALGVDVAQVTPILEANRPARPAHRHGGDCGPHGHGHGPAGKPGHAGLVAALAEALGLERSAVQAAFEQLHAERAAEHDARHEAMYAAVAEALGKTADEVRAAFEANRPQRRAR